MKKTLLLISFAIMFCANIDAQKNKNVRLTPRHTLLEEGWKLVGTTVEDGVTCEQYVKEINDEDVTVYTYRMDDGCFITIKGKKNAHYKYDYKYEECVLGDFLWRISPYDDLQYIRL